MLNGLLEAAMHPSRSVNEQLHMVHELEYVSGYSVEILLKLFAEGYTLSPPEQRIESMEELGRILDAGQ